MEIVIEEKKHLRLPILIVWPIVPFIQLDYSVLWKCPWKESIYILLFYVDIHQRKLASEITFSGVCGQVCVLFNQIAQFCNHQYLEGSS